MQHEHMQSRRVLLQRAGALCSQARSYAPGSYVLGLFHYVQVHDPCLVFIARHAQICASTLVHRGRVQAPRRRSGVLRRQAALAHDVVVLLERAPVQPGLQHLARHARKALLRAAARSGVMRQAMACCPERRMTRCHHATALTAGLIRSLPSRSRTASAAGRRRGAPRMCQELTNFGSCMV